MDHISTIKSLSDFSRNNHTGEILGHINDVFGEDAVFTTSFGLEDQVILHLLAGLKNLRIKVITLDTGRLFPETQSLWSRSIMKYGIPIQAWYPNDIEIKNYTDTHGPNAFFESPELRKECCRIRKVAPLNKALKNKKIWITGIRAEQSAERNEMNNFEWDDSHQVIKYHPLLDWSLHTAETYIKEHNVPVNPLHREGYLSIGCQPCTRAIRPGDDFRSGRWWWERSNGKECGLHTGKNKLTT